MPGEENGQTNALAQQASDYAIVKKYHIRKPMQAKTELKVLDEPVRPPKPVWPPRILETPNSAKKDDAITKSRRSNLESSYNFLSKDFGHGAERNIRRMELKYVLIDSELYLWTAEYLFLKCLDSDHDKVAMRKDHEGISGIRQSAPKMK